MTATETVEALPIGTTFTHNGDRVTLLELHGTVDNGQLLITADTPTGREQFTIWTTDNVTV